MSDAGTGYPWVHVTPAGNLPAILSDGIRRGRTRGTPGNYATNDDLIYLTYRAAARRWAAEIANRRGHAGPYAFLGVGLDGIPPASWRGKADTSYGPQLVVAHWDIPAAGLTLLELADIQPRPGPLAEVN